MLVVLLVLSVLAVLTVLHGVQGANPTPFHQKKNTPPDKKTFDMARIWGASRNSLASYIRAGKRSAAGFFAPQGSYFAQQSVRSTL